MRPGLLPVPITSLNDFDNHMIGKNILQDSRRHEAKINLKFFMVGLKVSSQGNQNFWKCIFRLFYQQKVFKVYFLAENLIFLGKRLILRCRLYSKFKFKIDLYLQ